MPADHEWGVFEAAIWNGGIETTSGYVVKHMNDKSVPYAHMRPVKTFAHRQAAERAAERMTNGS